MKIINCINRAWTGTLLGLVFGGFSLGVMAGPIGYLQIEGQIEVKSPGDERAVRVSDNNFTVFSGDRISTRQGHAVLVLNGGGSLGLAPSSEAAVALDSATRALEVDLKDGILLYSLPGHFGEFLVVLDDFRLQSGRSDERPVQVDRGGNDDEMIGRVERLEDGHVRVAVHTGQMQVHSGNGSRYMVAAGNQVGLMSTSASGLQVSRNNPQSAEFKIEAPEQVRTRQEFMVRWEIPEIPEDGFITIAEKGADAEEFESLASITQGQIIEFEAPNLPGDYEIRYIDAEAGMISDFVYLRVVGDPIAVPWFRQTQGLVTLGLLIGGGTYIICCVDDDDDPDPPSP
jgi:hypothetical protein